MLLNLVAKTVKRSIYGSIPKLKLVMRWKKSSWLFGDWLLKRGSDIKCVQNKPISDCIICMHQNERSQSSIAQKWSSKRYLCVVWGWGFGKEFHTIRPDDSNFSCSATLDAGLQPQWVYISFQSVRFHGIKALNAQHFPHHIQSTYLFKKITKAIYWHNANK